MSYRSWASALSLSAILLVSCSSGQSDASGTSTNGSGGGSQLSVTERATDDESSDPTDLKTMPDLVGLTETEARQKLSDLGLDAPNVATKKSFETPGVVLDQIPSAGRTITGGISLTVAESIPPVPNFVGKAIADVRAWAEPNGIEVRQETSLTTDKPDGEVLDQVPAPGAQASEEIIVTVAKTPTIVALNSIEPVEDNCHSQSDISMDGTLFPKAEVLYGTGCSAFVSYNLGRQWATLELSIGLSDVGGSDTIMSFEVLKDGQVATSETVAFGTKKKISIDVTGVLRLQINAKKIGGQKDNNLGIGDGQLIGSLADTSTSTTRSGTLTSG